MMKMTKVSMDSTSIEVLTLLPFLILLLDEDIQQLLIELNDTAIQALRGEETDNALECLKRGEQLLEAVTSEGKEIDRNLIVVVLYNLACCY